MKQYKTLPETPVTREEQARKKLQQRLHQSILERTGVLGQNVRVKVMNNRIIVDGSCVSDYAVLGVQRAIYAIVSDEMDIELDLVIVKKNIPPNGRELQ